MTHCELLAQVCASLADAIGTVSTLERRLAKDPPAESQSFYLRPSIHVVKGCLEACLDTLQPELVGMQRDGLD